VGLRDWLLAGKPIALFSLLFGVGLGIQLERARQRTTGFGRFALQVALSHGWLGRFRFGPAERLWRTLTYGRFEPLREAPRSLSG
jgi:uncharacterized protein